MQESTAVRRKSSAFSLSTGQHIANYGIYLKVALGLQGQLTYLNEVQFA